MVREKGMNMALKITSPVAWAVVAWLCVTPALAQVTPVGVWHTIDDRSNMIYEGTNTIQSLDLLGRKVLGNQGATLKKWGQRIAALVAEESGNEDMTAFVQPLAKLGQQMTGFTQEIGMKALGNADEVGGAAVDYMRVAGHLVFAYFWARMAQQALRQIAAGNRDPFYTAKVQTARFYFAKLLPETASLMQTARNGVDVLMDTEAALA